VRVSFGPETSEADIDRFVANWIAIKDRAQAA
jgi:cysteine sulfinate desulfinase/cysteine desulfurase-like protein